MALAPFTRSCGKNVSGASQVFVAEASVVTGITVTSGEISAITGTTPFMRVDAEQFSILWKWGAKKVGANNTVFNNEVNFDVVPPSKDTNTFLQAIIDGSPCGLLAIVRDNNGKCFLVGYDTTGLKTNPLRNETIDGDTKTKPSEEGGQVVKVKLTNEGLGLALPLDSTLTAALVAGTATFIKWS